MAGLGLLTGCGRLPFQGQQPAGIPRIGYLGFGRSGPDASDAAFRESLAERGYVEGSNLAIEWRFTERDEQLPELAAELVSLEVAVIVGATSQAATAARAATATIPIVTPSSGDPVAQGYAASLARPGGNVTGLTTLSSTEIARKRLGLLKEIAPAAARVAVLWNPANTAKVLELQQAQAAAAILGLTLLSFEVRSPDDFARAFEAMAAAQVDALDTLSEGVTNARPAQIADFAITRRVPSVFDRREFADAGGLMAYGPNRADLYRRAATFVDKILKGAKPAELPFELPTTFDFVINIKTARELGLTIPQSVLQQATELIQ